MDDDQKSYFKGIVDCKAQIELLNQEVDVHCKQMESAQTMLEEKEMLASELCDQLEGATKDEELQVREPKENLAAKSCKNISMELNKRNKYVDTLEDKLTTINREEGGSVGKMRKGWQGNKPDENDDG
jgi:hypothetical protein